ncbi:Septum site-determining protein MinD [compost metagenome]
MLIDCPAGIEQGFENSVIGADRALVVVNPELTSIRDADRVIGMIEERNIRDIKLIINRIDYEMTKNGDMLDIEDIVNSLNIELIGIIIDDRAITIATNRGEPITLNKNSKLRMSFMRIAMRITGKKLPFKYDDRSDKSFSSTFRKLFASK